MLFLFQTLNFFDKLVFGLSAVPMMKELSLSPKEFGLIGSSFFLLFSLSGMAVGLFVIGRFPTKWILLILAAVWSATQIPIFFTSSVAVLIGCRIILGAGEGPGLPTAFHACYNWFAAEKRSVPSAVVLQGISVGLLVGGPFLTYIIVNYGWRTGFLVCGLLGLAWMLAWALIGGEGPYAAANVSHDASQAAATVPARMLWCDPTVIGVIIMSTMSYWIVGMSATWLPPYLQLGLGYKPTDVGWIIFGIYLFQSPLLLGGSWITQTMQRQRLEPARLPRQLRRPGAACRGLRAAGDARDHRAAPAHLYRDRLRRSEPDHDLWTGCARRGGAGRAARQADRRDLFRQRGVGAGLQRAHRLDRRRSRVRRCARLRPRHDIYGRHSHRRRRRRLRADISGAHPGAVRRDDPDRLQRPCAAV